LLALRLGGDGIMAQLKVVAICVTAPAGLAVAAVVLSLAGSFGAVSDATAFGKAALFIRESCKSDAIRPALPTSLGLAMLRHLRS
jgi:hypothetical protein